MPDRTRGCSKRGRIRPGARLLLGIGCVLLGLLILLICAPDWLIGLVMAMLLLGVGFYWIGFR